MSEGRRPNSTEEDPGRHSKSEGKLSVSEEWFRSLVQHSWDIVAVLEADSSIRYVSPAVEWILGYRPEDMIGREVFGYAHPDDLERVASTFAQIRNTPGASRPVELRLQRADGSWRYLEAVLDNLLEDPAVGGIVSNMRDITERKRAEETRARLAAIVESSDDAIIGKTLDGIITSWNSGAQNIYGYSAEEVVGKPINILVPFDRPNEISQILDSIRRGKAVDHYETMRIAKDGRHLDVSLTISPIRDSTGNIVGASTIARDVTERKRTEEKIREVREAERNRLARNLHDSALQDLTYALAEVQLVQAKNPELDHQLERAASALIRAGKELRGAVYDLRLGEERDRSFTEFLESLVQLNRQITPDRNIRLEVEDEFPSKPLDEKDSELLRILQEALTNARRHSGAKNVLVSLGAKEDRLWAEVKDDGRGFDPKTTTTGMGIKGMRERARALEGDLKIESEPGEGAKVRFEAVLERDEQEPEEEARILLVEDHASFRQAVASMFEREPGFVVARQAGSLAEARKMLDGIDLAIIDLGLPDGYGGELIKELREATPRAQALVLSASIDRAEIARAVEAGAAGVLHKSVSIGEVVEAVRRLRAGETLLSLEEVVELLRYAGSERDRDEEARQAIEQLTPREKEVLQALAEGLDGKDIAERLHISDKTERNHIASILEKLGVHSRLQALVFAVRYGVAEIRRKTGGE